MHLNYIQPKMERSRWQSSLTHNITRALYFFYVRKRIVVTNGFVKKTQKTLPGEIKLAKDKRKDWIERQERENENVGKKGRR